MTVIRTIDLRHSEVEFTCAPCNKTRTSSLFDDPGCEGCGSKSGGYKCSGCDNCAHFTTSPMAYPGGKCLLHKISCGAGLICNDRKARK